MNFLVVVYVNYKIKFIDGFTTDFALQMFNCVFLKIAFLRRI